ncbi:DUF6868 family protein [Acinetobacter sp. ANC 4641]|uniref:DUF6868 family protein n=1 Tax=Acinetobacter sp. ANC 4641 TaxID=2529847 RepID=UPI00103E82B0|nr:hypothetical protein [Acinetobacter sp. ANC 4641]TCB11036.1 hypothetical protein E0H78_08430 [Acinetobacter sp. ANC 4641]
MSYEVIRQVLLYATLINYAILIIWFLLFVFARQFLKRLQGSWFNLSDNTFNMIHYSGIAFYKIAIIMFNLVPWIAMTLARNP